MVRTMTIQIHQIDPNFWVELHPQAGYVYRLTSLNKHSFAAFLALTQEHGAAAQAAGLHLYRLLDISQAAHLTPYAAAELIELAAQLPGNPSHSFAVLASGEPALQLMHMLVKRLPQAQQNNIRVFAHEAVALDWLAHRQAQYGDMW